MKDFPVITKILLCAIMLVKQAQCNSNSDDIYLFSPSPIIQIPQNQICENGQTVEKILLLPNLKNSQLLSWGSQCGWNLIDFEDSSNISIKRIQMQMESSAQTMAIQDSIIWIAYEKTVKAYSLKNEKEFQILQTLNKQITDYSTFSIYISDDKKFLFLQALYHLESYLIQDLTNVKYLNTIKRVENVFCLNISIQLNYILIGLKAGIVLYSWQYDSAQQNYVAVEQCFRFGLITVLKIEFLNETAFIFQSFVSGLWVADLKGFLEGSPCNSIQFYPIQGKPNAVIYMNYLLVSTNKRYVICEFKVSSISIFEVTLKGDYQFPILQEIDITEKTYDLQISLDQQFIYSSSFTNLNIFMRSIPNYQNKVPNIQNGEQNYVFSDFPINSDSGRRCVLKDNLLFYAKMLDGAYILSVDPYTKYLKILSRLFDKIGSYELVMPMADPTKLIVGNSIMLQYDISDLTTPVLKFSQDFSRPNIDGDYIVISKDQKTGYVAGGYEGLMIIDLSDFYKPLLISSILHNFLAYQATTAESVQVDSKEEYAYVSYRYFGVIVYDVRDKVNPKVVSHIQTNGAEDLKITSDDKHIIISDSHRGITIVNIEDPTNIFEVSSLYVEGETKRTTFIFNEQYLLSISSARGNLQLIDIRDKKNPRILQKYIYQKKSQANDVCVTSDNSIAYLVLNQQIILLNLFSTSVQFNVDFLLIEQGHSPLKKILDMNDVLLLGQKVEIKLVQIYPKNRVQLTDVKFYDNYLQYNLPNWAVFQEIEQKLTLHITNEALNKQNPNAVVMKSFLFQIKEPLLMTDFIRTELNIDKLKSNQIYYLCLKNKLVGSENLVTESQSENILGVFSGYTESEQNHILKVIKSKIFYYPVYINVKGSLQVIANVNDEGLIKVSGQSLEIQSISDTVKIQVVVLPDQGQFQKYLYPGVLVYFNENQDTMKLEGEIEAINKILKLGGFKFANYTYHEDIILTMTIDDTINYPVTLKFKASNPNLIQLNNKVQNNENNNIQSDFSSKFPDSSVYILSSFSYALSTKIFVDKDNDHLTYSAKIQIDGEFQQIPESFWLNFQSSDHTFYATTKASQYGDKVILKVIASDGYTEASDILVIDISLVPVTYILQIVAQIAGPILGLLGLWKYKALFCNFIRQKQYSGYKLYYQPESQVQIQIPLLEDQLEQAKTLWNEFYLQMDKKSILIEINQLKLRYRLIQNNSMTDSYLMKNECSSQMESRLKQENLTIVKADSYPFNQVKSDVIVQFSPLNSPCQDSQFLESQTMQNPDTPKSATKENKERNARLKQKTQYNYIKQAKNSFVEKSKQQKKLGIFQSQNINERDNLNLEFFESNGYLNTQVILKKVQNYYINNLKKTNNFIIEQLNVPTSRLSQSIISLCAQEIAILEKTPMTLLNFLRDTAIQEGFTPNTWYRAYVQIVPQFNQIFIDPFPKLAFNENKILKQINIIKSNLPNESNTDINVYLPLVKQNIQSIAYGLTFDKNQFLNKIRGESLEVFTHDILCIKTYRPVKKSSFSYFTCQRKQRDICIEKELSQNSMVPSWITSVDISNGVILISGRLHQKDVGQYILKVFDTQQFIIKQIDIVVQSKIQVGINQSEIVSQKRQTVHFFNQNSPRIASEVNTEDIPQEKNNIEFKIYSYKQTQKNTEYASANSLFDKMC